MFGNRLKLIEKIKVLFLCMPIYILASGFEEEPKQAKKVHSEHTFDFLAYDSRDASPALSNNESSSECSPIARHCSIVLLVASCNNANSSSHDSVRSSIRESHVEDSDCDDGDSMDMNLGSRRATPLQTIIPFSRQGSLQAQLMRQTSDVSLDRMIASSSTASLLSQMVAQEQHDARDLAFDPNCFNQDEQNAIHGLRSTDSDHAGQDLLTHFRVLQVAAVKEQD